MLRIVVGRIIFLMLLVTAARSMFDSAGVQLRPVDDSFQPRSKAIDVVTIEAVELL